MYLIILYGEADEELHEERQRCSLVISGVTYHGISCVRYLPSISISMEACSNDDKPTHEMLLQAVPELLNKRLSRHDEPKLALPIQAGSQYNVPLRYSRE